MMLLYDVGEMTWENICGWKRFLVLMDVLWICFVDGGRGGEQGFIYPLILGCQATSSIH